jgi:outer membrane protein
MIQQKKNFSIVLVFALHFITQNLIGQTARSFTLSEMYEIAIANSEQLKLSRTGVEMAKSFTRMTGTAALPSIDISLSASYIGNGLISDRDFSNAKNIEMPHFGNNFSIEASQVIYGGGAINRSIEKARLQEQVAQLNYDRNELDICFQITAYYLDLYKLQNQHEVFLKNIEQTKILILEIKSKELQGMALSSDVNRYELMLQNLKMSLIEIENNRMIINNQLVLSLGLPSETLIVPDSSILKQDLNMESQAELLQIASESLPELKSAILNKEIATKELAIAKTDFYPHLSIVAANHLDGPILIEMPSINNNFNYWYVGIGLKYNLASLYKSKQKLNFANKQRKMAEHAEALILENTQVAVKSAYIKFMESIEKLATYETASQLANENYRLINNRYLGGLVLITEMLDAINTKLNAELQLVNSRLNVIYNYYLLQREIGKKIKK